MKIIVTGGAGFIGSVIAEELVRVGHDVFIVDNLSTGKREHLRSQADLVQIDILDYELLRNVFKIVQPDVVIHQAAQISVQKSLEDPRKDARTNIIGTVSLLQLCKEFRTKKLIFASTAAVYGNPQHVEVDETHPLKPESFYGLSKLQAEKYIQLFSDLYNIDYTILRYANVFGPRQDPSGEGGVISIFMDLVRRGRPITIYGDGEQTRDFIYVKDIAAANLAALTKGSRGIYNIGYNKQTSLNRLVEHLKLISQNEIEVLYKSSRPGDIRHSCLNSTLATKELKWLPSHKLEEGLRETYFSI